MVRDLYEMYLGGKITMRNTSAELASYILHTGSSWRGLIGDTLVIATFDRPDLPAPLAPRRMEPLSKTRIFEKPWTGGAATVYYRGPSTPTVTGRMLRFHRSSWRPTPADDILLVFNDHRLNLQ